MIKLLSATVLIVTTTHLQAQNIGIGAASPSAKLHVKGSTDVAQLIVEANGTQSNTNPLIKLRKSDGTDLSWIHSDHYSNFFMGQHAGRVNNLAGGGFANIFIGYSAGYSNTTGGDNTAIGYSALAGNVFGDDNTAFGAFALEGNTGTGNTATGKFALRYNTGGSNVAYGHSALYTNTSGFANTAIGRSALSTNSTGAYNTAVGYNALTANKNHYNTGVGYGALYFTDNAQYNVALGYQSGYFYENGYNNVFLGANTDVNGHNYYNVIAIGQGAVCTNVSQVTIGNSATTAYRAYAGWSNISDERYKKNIKENVPGLAFINKLRPVTYTLDATELDNFLHKNHSPERRINDEAKKIMNKALSEKEAIRLTGFVAQEVERSAKELGFIFSGIDAAKNDNDVYGLRYAEFVVPLVKAVQEQQLQMDEMRREIVLLKEQNKLFTQLLKSKN